MQRFFIDSGYGLTTDRETVHGAILAHTEGTLSVHPNCARRFAKCRCLHCDSWKLVHLPTGYVLAGHLRLADAIRAGREMFARVGRRGWWRCRRPAAVTRRLPRWVIAWFRRRWRGSRKDTHCPLE